MTTYIKIGNQKIILPEDKADISIEAARELLKFSHPEVKDAIGREASSEAGRALEFSPKPGRKG